MFRMSMSSMANYINFNQTDVVITTPAQFDMLNSHRRIKNLNPKYVVVDEADSMLEVNTNHGKALQSFFNEIGVKPKAPQTARRVIFSAATMPSKIYGVAFESYFQSILKDIQISRTENFHKLNENINHEMIEVDELTLGARLELLKDLVFASDYDNFIVFCSTNKDVVKVTEHLITEGVPSIHLTGDMAEPERLKNLLKFKSQDVNVLVCSDAVNRGFHFDFDCHVIQFDAAKHVFNLLHRFGRTGRLGKKGMVTSLVTKNDYKLLSMFTKLMENSKTVDPLFSRKRSLGKKNFDNIEKTAN